MRALGTLGDSRPEVLLNTVWFLLTLHMGLHGKDEHYKLMYVDIAIQTIPDGPKYVKFNERDTKICSGETRADNLSTKCGAPQIIYLVAHFVFLKCFFKSAPQKCALLNHLLFSCEL